VLEAVFILLEFPSPSRRIFIGSYSLPPLLFAVSVLQKISGTDGVCTKQSVVTKQTLSRFDRVVTGLSVDEGA
jgi:hypothetical protein